MAQIARQDAVSLSFAAVGATTLMFQSLTGGSSFFGVVIALLLIILGIVASTQFHVNKEAPLPDVETEKGKSEVLLVGLASLLTLSLFFVFSYLVPSLTFTSGQVTAITFWGQFQFATTGGSTTTYSGATLNIPGWIPPFLFVAILIPVAEENFFRGFWGNLAVSSLPSLEGLAYPIGAVLGTGAAIFLGTLLVSIPGGVLFGVFHTPAYAGSLPIILTLSADGTIIIALNSLTGRLSNGILAHVGNNALSFFIQQSSVLKLIPGLPASPIALILPTIVLPLSLAGLAIYRSKTRHRSLPRRGL